MHTLFNFDYKVALNFTMRRKKKEFKLSSTNYIECDEFKANEHTMLGIRGEKEAMMHNDQTIYEEQKKDFIEEKSQSKITIAIKKEKRTR